MAAPLRLSAERVPEGVQVRWPETAATVKLLGRPGLEGPADRTPAPGAAVQGWSRVTLPIRAEPLRIFWLQAE